MRVLAISDETDRSLTPERLREMGPDLVVSCGDLGFDYLDYVASAANAPLLYVPGNHDPELGRRGAHVSLLLPQFDEEWGPSSDRLDGGTNIDGKVVTVGGITLAGLGGSIRYRVGPNQYTEREMAARARRIRRRARLRRQPVDILVTHAPPRGVGDLPDAAHQGFAAFASLIDELQPRVMIHGHIHPHGFVKPDRKLGSTRIVNVIPHRVLDIDP